MKYRIFLLVASCAPMVGCAQLGEWLAQPHVQEGVGQVGSGALRAATNPLDFFAWYEIAAGVAVLIGGPPVAAKVAKASAAKIKEKIINPEPTQ